MSLIQHEFTCNILYMIRWKWTNVMNFYHLKNILYSLGQLSDCIYAVLRHFFKNYIGYLNFMSDLLHVIYLVQVKGYFLFLFSTGIWALEKTLTILWRERFLFEGLSHVQYTRLFQNTGNGSIDVCWCFLDVLSLYDLCNDLYWASK